MGEREEHMEAVKRAFQAMGRQSYEELRALLADDVVFSGPLQPETRGADEMIAGLKKWDEAGVRTTVESVEVLGDEHKVVSLGHFRVSRDGRTFDVHPVYVIELRGGKASKITVYTAEPQQLQEMADLMA